MGAKKEGVKRPSKYEEKLKLDVGFESTIQKIADKAKKKNAAKKQAANNS